METPIGYLKEIFFGNELTIDYSNFPNDNICTLNKWTKKHQILFPCDVIFYLIDHNILIESSGNFETNEVHYTFNSEFDSIILDIQWEYILGKIKPIIRETKLNQLGFN